MAGVPVITLMTAAGRRPAATARRRPRAGAAEAGGERRHDAPALRARGVPREAGGADAAAGDQPGPLPRGPRPYAHWRPDVVAYGRPEGDAATGPEETMGRVEGERCGAAKPRYWTWAALMRRAFDLNVLRSPCCASRMELIATIDDPAVIHRILAHLGL